MSKLNGKDSRPRFNRGKGVPWHKTQLVALRHILAAAHGPDEYWNVNVHAARFAGAAAAIIGAKIPAYHKPLLKELKAGLLFYQGHGGGKEDVEKIADAITWVEQSLKHKRRTAQKKAMAEVEAVRSGLHDMVEQKFVEAGIGNGASVRDPFVDHREQFDDAARGVARE